MTPSTDSSDHDITAAVAAVRDRMAAACARAGRSPGAVRLVAASKNVPVGRVRAAAAAGVEDFAENYARELAEKAPEVAARWHFIGKLQRGTVRHVADLADVVHTAEPGGAVEALARRARDRGRTLDVLIQVDFTRRRQGTHPEDLDAFTERLHGSGGVRLAGLMTLPPLTDDPEASRPYFVRLRELRDGLSGRFAGLEELSMGMSGDYEVAIEEGATMVRIGTALFGRRSAPPGG
jgi:pyridoxal phosphate enzyme (YggS family)